MEEKQQSEVSDTRKKHDPVEGKKKNIMKDILGTIDQILHFIEHLLQFRMLLKNFISHYKSTHIRRI